MFNKNNIFRFIISYEKIDMLLHMVHKKKEREHVLWQ
jgi:hypothetical protein